MAQEVSGMQVALLGPSAEARVGDDGRHGRLPGPVPLGRRALAIQPGLPTHGAGRAAGGRRRALRGGGTLTTGRPPLYITRMSNPFPLRLPAELLAWLKAESSRRGLPMATLIRVLLLEVQRAGR